MSGGNRKGEKVTWRTPEDKETINGQESESVNKSGKECGRETERLDESTIVFGR